MPYRDDPALHPSSPGGGGPRYSTSADSYGAAAPQDQSYTSHHHNHFYSPPASASVGTFDQYHDANQYNSHSQQQLGTPIHSPNTPYSATFLSSPGASPGYADNASARSRSPRPVSTLMQQLNLDDSRQSMNMARPDSQATFGGGSYYSDKIPGSPGAPGTPMSYGGGGGYVDGQHYSNGQTQAYRSVPARNGEYGFIGNEAGTAAGAAGGAGGKAARRGGLIGFIKRKPVWATLIALLILVAAGVGIGVGVTQGMKSSSGASKNNLADANAQGSGSSGSNSGSGSSSGSSSSSSPAAPVLDSSGNDISNITQLPFWNYADPQAKVVGVSLGNWLVLERWMDEDWFTSTAGGDAWDEWDFSNSLGPAKAKAALEDHWNTWIVESDLDTLASVGINHIRIPLGFWTMIPTTGNEPYVNHTQLAHLEQMLGWMHKRSMRALIDMHGMPGSQNGDQSSGHNTTNPTWFNSANQARSDTVIDNLLDWINASPYKSVVASIAPANEPCGPNQATPDKLSTVQSFLERCYPKLKGAGFPMFFHHSFASNPTSYWQDFATGKDPSFLVMNDNPYQGYFPAKYDQDSIIQAVCDKAQSYVGFPVPIAMTEWSLASGPTDDTWEQHYYNTQASAWAWSAGQFFWSFKLKQPQNRVLAAPPANQAQYSFIDLVNSGVIPKTSANQTSIAYLNAFDNPGCGPIQTRTYSNPAQ